MENYRNLHFNIEIQAEKHPDKIAVYAGNDSVTYNNLWKKILFYADTLEKLGMKAGNTVVLYMPNCLEYIFIFYAAEFLKLNIILMNSQYRNSELMPLLEIASPDIVITYDREGADFLYSLDSHLRVLSFSDLTESTPVDINLNFPYNLLSSGENLPGACISISTSGSTGSPKIVVNTYKTEFVNACLYTGRMDADEEDVFLTGLPASQRFGMAAMIGCLLVGGTLVLLSKFIAAEALRLIDEYKVTIQYGVPTMFLKEMEVFESNVVKKDISSLRTGIVAGAFGSDEIFRWFDHVAGCRLLNCYGTSEIGGLTMASPEDNENTRYYTCGSVFENAFVEIRDSENHILQNNKSGEIIAKVPWITLGYLNNRELTSKMIDEEGFFHTGDIGQIDEYGNLIVIGRKSDLIIRGGYNIFPAELEKALLELPEIREACVIGYQDKKLGERICAFICTFENVDIKDGDLRNRLLQSIAKYKLPDRFVWMEEIPKLPGGKYDRKKLLQSIN